MSSYESFARVYDLFMDNIPYEEWCGYLHTLLEKYDVTDGLVLELGCGTGTMTELLADCGYDMIGVDNSADMLEIALEKKERSGKDILYLQQNATIFGLNSSLRSIDISHLPPQESVCLKSPADPWLRTDTLRYMHRSPGRARYLPVRYAAPHGYRDHLPAFLHRKSHRTGTHLHTGSRRAGTDMSDLCRPI